MTRISIVVPVYNAEDYVEECIKSIQKQTFKDIEIIIIDDGSIDNSGIIADRLAENDGRIRVLHQENKGLVESRKKGVMEASSEYIGFVDADDWIDPDMYKEMLEEMERNQAELVLTEIFHYTTNGERVVKHPISAGRYNYDEIVDKVYPRLINNQSGIHPSVGTKLFRKYMLLEIMQYIEGNIKIAEDVVLSYPYITRSKTVYIMNKAFYHYRFNPNSMCHKKNHNVLSETELVINQLRFFYQEHEQKNVLMKSLNGVIYSTLIFSYKFHATNELRSFYLFPYKSVKKDSDIVLYGAGNVGMAYYNQLKLNEYCKVVLWVDRNYMKVGKKEVLSPDAIASAVFDYVVIAVANSDEAAKIESYLRKYMSIKREKIVYEKALEGMEIMML